MLSLSVQRVAVRRISACRGTDSGSPAGRHSISPGRIAGDYPVDAGSSLSFQDMLLELFRAAVAVSGATALGEGLAVTFDNSRHTVLTHVVFFVIAALCAVIFVLAHAAHRRRRDVEGRTGIKTRRGTLSVRGGRIRGQDRAIDAEDTDIDLKDPNIE